jgi:hypothetical protein
VAKFLYKMSDIDTAEFRKLTLLAAGIDPSEIPPILDTAEWRRLLIVAINNASSGGGTAGVSSIRVNGGGLQTGSVSLTIPAAQVNSNWNSSTGLSQILNKPDVVLKNTTDATPVNTIRALTQTAYDAIPVKDNFTIYFIK